MPLGFDSLDHGGLGMIAGAIAGLSLVVTVAVEPILHSPLGETAARMQMSAQQKKAVMQPLMRSATDCIVRAVTADPNFRISMAPGDINELIVYSMTACIEPMQAMIDAHNRLFGDGSGETFFMGPYLEVLPAAVARQVAGSVQ
jgi:hypothetical protein